jgi:cytochrome c
MFKITFFSFAFVALMAAAPGNAPVSNTADPTIPADIEALLSKYGCNACHSVKRKLVGPKWQEIGAKGYSKKRIVALVKKPEPANWPGYPEMQPQTTVPKADLDKIAGWIVTLK